MDSRVNVLVKRLCSTLPYNSTTYEHCHEAGSLWYLTHVSTVTTVYCVVMNVSMVPFTGPISGLTGTNTT